MGGCQASVPLNDQNLGIKLLENDTGFRKHTALSIETTFRRFASSLEMNANGVKKVCNSLNLWSQDGSLVNSTFMSKFEVDQQYSMQLLMTFGVLNSKSSPTEKADSIWNAYDADFNDELPNGAIKTMISDIVDCCVPFVEPLFAGRIDDRSNNYLDNLKKRMPTFITNMVKDFQEDIFSKSIVTKEEFLRWIQGDAYVASMFQPEHLREKIEEIPYNPPGLSGKGAFAALLNKS